MNPILFIEKTTNNALKQLFDYNSSKLIIQKTRKEFEGNFTLTTFNIAKDLGKKPDEIADIIGNWLKKEIKEVSNYNVVKGFLNISLSDIYWQENLKSAINNDFNSFEKESSSGKTILLEYSSPNTNKPLHLGHIRNILLGWSVSEILKANGHKVVKVNLINDRGIHICKSMIAWLKFGKGETPETNNIKGDHLVGKYYVAYDKAYKAEVTELISKGISKEQAEKEAPILLEAQAMLQKWEKNEPEVIELWKKMNAWVYNGFDATYEKLGVNFDKLYYESNTYLLGKDVVQEGLNKGVFYKKENGSVCIDLTNDGLDEKVVLRSDGTSVYITQDIGTAIQRFNEYPDLSQAIYTVGNEQDYHFKVLFKILEKLGYSWAKECYHLSYGMVELPEGKMKSREGTVVDADDLINEMIETAKNTTNELGKVDGFNQTELQHLYHTIGMGALKYFILKVDPKKKMLFDPKESIDFNGHTGPFIQYTYARIQSILRKVDNKVTELSNDFTLEPVERDLSQLLFEFQNVIKESGATYNPGLVANYVYELAKTFNRFYHDLSVLKETHEEKRNFRVMLTELTGKNIKNAMKLLGIEVPDKM